MQVSKHSFARMGFGFEPPWAVNTGLIVGTEKTLIIDTGPNFRAAQTIHGYASLARPDNALLVFNCEAHFDHVGGNSYFADLGIDIYGHPEIQRQEADLAAEKESYNKSIPNQVRAEQKEADPDESKQQRFHGLKWWQAGKHIGCRALTKLAFLIEVQYRLNRRNCEQAVSQQGDDDMPTEG